MNYRRNDAVALAAAKAGISQASAYRRLKDAKEPVAEKVPRARRRPDPLAGFF